jgi:hypothetical protein
VPVLLALIKREVQSGRSKFVVCRLGLKDGVGGVMGFARLVSTPSPMVL